MTNRQELRVDPARTAVYETGIYVRARAPNGSVVSADIAHLDRDSLMLWLRARGGDNLWAEHTVAVLLGWTPLPGGPHKLMKP